MTVTESWTCPACGRTATTPFCAECGERPRDARDLTLRGLLVLVFHAFSNFDGKVLGSLRCLLTRPGELSVAYVQGRRLPYVGPFQLFFLANVAFFGFQSLTHANIFSSTLDSHLHHQDWSALAQRLVERKLETRHLTLADYAPLFDSAVVLHAKSLLILMVVPFALLLPLVFRRSQQPFVAHVVFALHAYSFLLLLFCTSLTISGLDRLRGGLGLDSPRMDNALTVVNLSACALYLLVATGKFYRTSGWTRVAQAAGLTLAVAVIGLGYRFLLLWITLYGT